MSENSHRCESGESVSYSVNRRSFTDLFDVVDAVWPLIGHIKWYTDFCRELVKEVQESGPGMFNSLTLLEMIH